MSLHAITIHLTSVCALCVNLSVCVCHCNNNTTHRKQYPPPPPIPTATTTITFNNGGSGSSSSGIGSSNTSSTQSPSHSRSSSTTSSSGYCNSSSLSPVQSNKVSPLHSRTSSENELILEPPRATKPTYSVHCDFSYLPPPPPSLLTGLSLSSPAGSMENPEAVEQPPVEAAADPASFGPNGLAVAQESAADSTDGVTQNEYGFIYKTMGGSVIRSVFPPGSSGRYQVGPLCLHARCMTY